MKMLYSFSTKGFYDKTLHKTIPEDAIEISDSTYTHLLTGKNSGKAVTLEDGVLILTDVDVTTSASIVSERHWRDSELDRADVELYKVQDSDSKSIGSVSDWRTYRKALRSWPEQKDFPNIEFRPKAPDNKE